MGRSRSPRRDRRRSRSRSRERRRPERDRDRDRHRRSRSRDRDRRRHRSRSREKRSRERDRSRERERRDRDRHTDREAGRSGGHRNVLPIPAPVVLDPSEMEGKSEEEIEMMKVMGFGGFDSTKGKPVQGNDNGVSAISTKRKYRQYMNRKGGFNRPLDFIA